MKRQSNLIWGSIALYTIVLLITIYLAFDITNRTEQLKANSSEIITRSSNALTYTGDWNQGDTLLFVSGEYPPYVYTDEGKLQGISYDALVAILDEMGVDYQFEMMSWSRALKLIDNGQAFAAFPFAVSEERLKKYYFSDAYHTIPDKSDFFYAYGANDSYQTMTSLEDLYGLKVGCIYGYYYLETLESLDLELEFSVSEKECLEKLKDGRIDVAIFDPLVAEFMIDTYFETSSDQFHQLSLSMRSDQAGDRLMLNKENAYASEFLNQFNQLTKP